MASLMFGDLRQEVKMHNNDQKHQQYGRKMCIYFWNVLIFRNDYVLWLNPHLPCAESDFFFNWLTVLLLSMFRNWFAAPQVTNDIRLQRNFTDLWDLLKRERTAAAGSTGFIRQQISDGSEANPYLADSIITFHHTQFLWTTWIVALRLHQRSQSES